ncbi:MAG: L,D-transpeptidase family protein [Sphingobacteriales bacterium]
MPKFLIAILIPLLLGAARKPATPDSPRAANIRAKVWPQLQSDLKAAGLKDDQPIYLRIFKIPGTMEVWVKSGKQFKLFRQYLVCTYSGGLGTKTHNKDGKCPEGYYSITPNRLNPMSNYHLAMNIGYPNAYDQSRGYTGDEIMIHGDCVSIGCYAMTDAKIEEIYTLVYEAFQHGQKAVPVSIYPFKLTNTTLDTYSEWSTFSFWESLKPGYDIFERTHVPPVVTVVGKNYSFR